jgi:hypothetical protein
MVKGSPISLYRVNTNVGINIIPLGSYDILIGMDWLKRHHVVLDCHNKTLTCLDEEGKQSICERNSKAHFYKGDLSPATKDMFSERMSIVCSPCGVVSIVYSPCGADLKYKSAARLEYYSTRISTKEGDRFIYWFCER